MSYNDGIVADAHYHSRLCFCGKCLLRIRGWRIEGLANLHKYRVEPNYW